MFQCGESGRSLLASGRWSLVVRTGSGYVWTRAATNGRTVRINRSDAHDLSAWFRGSAHPDGDPTRAIYTPGSRILHPTPPKSPFLAFCALFPVSFWIYIAFSCLFAHYSHILGIFQSFSFSFQFSYF